MPITAQAKGKTFTFPDGTTPEQIGVVIDEFFNNQPAPQTQPELTRAQARQQARTGRRPEGEEENTGVSDFIKGIPGAIPNIVSSGIGNVIGGVGAAGELLLSQDVGRAASVLDKTQQALTIPPIGEKAKQTLQTTAEAVAPISEPIERAVDAAGEKILETTGSPALAATFETAVSLAPDLLGAGLASRGIKRINKSNDAENIIDEVSDTPKNVSERSLVTPEGDATIVFGPKSLSKKQQEIVNKLNEYPSNPDLATFVISKEGKPEKSKILQQAVDLYGDPGVIGVLKASSEADKKAVSKMLSNSQKLFRDPIKIGKPQFDTHRTVIGDALTKRVKEANKILKTEGKKIQNFVENNLAGNNISLEPVKTNLQDYLENRINASYDPETGKIDYTGSTLDDDQFLKAQKTISRFANKIKGDQIDARQAHTIKKQLDNLLDFNSTETGLSGDADFALKQMRADINKSIGNNFDEYSEINTKFSENKKAMESLQNALGKKLDLDNPNQLGNELRKLASQYQKGEIVKPAIYDLEKTLSKYGVDFDDDIVNLVNIGSYLERRFPWMQKIRSFEQSVRAGNKQAALDVLDVADMAGTGGTTTVIRKGLDLLTREKKPKDDETISTLLKMLNDQGQ